LRGFGNKQEASDELNELLGTDIDFTKLKKDDLSKLHEALSDTRNLIAMGLRGAADRRMNDFLGIVRDRRGPRIIDLILEALGGLG